MIKTNHFNTLNDALKSELLLESWDISFRPIEHGQTFSYTFEDGSKYGYYVSIHRFETGKYERPVHYRL